MDWHGDVNDHAVACFDFNCGVCTGASVMVSCSTLKSLAEEVSIEPIQSIIVLAVGCCFMGTGVNSNFYAVGE